MHCIGTLRRLRNPRGTTFLAQTTVWHVRPRIQVQSRMFWELLSLNPKRAQCTAITSPFAHLGGIVPQFSLPLSVATNTHLRTRQLGAGQSKRQPRLAAVAANRSGFRPSTHMHRYPQQISLTNSDLDWKLPSWSFLHVSSWNLSMEPQPTGSA